MQISRSELQKFLRVARKAGLLRRNHARPADIQITSNASEITLRMATDKVDITYRTAGQPLSSVEEILLPVEFLQKCAGATEDLVSIERATSESAIARWQDCGVPQRATFSPVEARSSGAAPLSPAAWGDGDSGLLGALRDASACVDSESSRYALGCLQLRGEGGRIAATDSRQLLVQRGFSFPWSGDRLMKVSPVLQARELSKLGPCRIGEAGDWILVEVGRWRIAHPIERDCRFPEIGLVLPPRETLTSAMVVDPADVTFLLERLGKLPCGDELNRPVTVELNGSVAVRSRGEEGSPATELVLSRSRRVGDERRVSTNRVYLQKALALGFREIGFQAGGRPVAAWDERRDYVWMPLAEGTEIKHASDAVRIASVEGAAPQKSRGRRSVAA